MMKRILFLLSITLAMASAVQAAQVTEADARQVAERFFSAKSPRLSSQSGSPMTRLAYTAQGERFYVFDRGRGSGFVVVAGDDRLPQVLGYGETGDFAAATLPPSLQYWMDEMDRQIAFLQANDNVAAHSPIKRATPVGPLLTTQWDQSSPYNDFCPTYVDNTGATVHAVSGCVATAMAQIMNYHQWPAVGTGSHSYICNVNNSGSVELSADFSQSNYRWDLMLDTYDANSSQESREAVAHLMSDVGISVDMGYGSSSGASEVVALQSLKRYFGYYGKGYLLNRDYYGADEWDQMLVDELSARRPILYCGYDLDSSTGGGGHAFVIDGFDADGYFHLNWGWGGRYDGFFLVSALNPGGMNFKYGQDGMFGVVPAPQADNVPDVLYLRSELIPVSSVVKLGKAMTLRANNFVVEGNKLDTAGYEERNGRRYYYADIPMSLDIYDMSGVDCAHKRFTHRQSLDAYWWSSGSNLYMDVPASLDEGEYRIKLSYSEDGGNDYDKIVLAPDGRDTYVRMMVRGDSAYLTDCFLANTYSIDSFGLPTGIKINDTIAVEAKLSNPSWSSEIHPTGNVYLSLLKDGDVVASSEMYSVMIPFESSKTLQMHITAPSQWGRYVLVMRDESGSQMQKVKDFWYGEAEDYSLPLFVLPVCEELTEDFESMAASSSTNARDVQGNFTTWSFTKGGVRAPGEGRCHGTNSVMLKKGSTFYTTTPLTNNFFLAQAAFFNQSSTLAKYTLEYSRDGGTTWVKASTLDGLDAAEVPAKSEALGTWLLNLTSAQPVNFRIAMVGGGSAATYVDDVSLYYIDRAGDVNGDGEVNIADVNACIDVILAAMQQASADVNGDGEINISDINTIIDMLLAQ